MPDITYAGAGVDIDAGERAVERIKAHVRRTYRPEVLGDLGGFGGLFAFSGGGGRADPVLVSSTDGVGTKAAIAAATGRYDTIGLDLVAMCVDDIACQGAEPLFFLDYVSFGQADPVMLEAIVAGIAEGCHQAGCALVGGEMAEHHGAMGAGEFDLAGFVVGVVDRDALITGERVAPGDALIGLPSPGLRSNGYTLARHVLLERAGLPVDGPAWPGADHTLADELLRPSVIYSPALLDLADPARGAVDVRAAAHITGGGLAANLARVLPAGVDATVWRNAWTPPRVFAEIARLGPVSEPEMERVFNLGIGMVLAVPADQAERACTRLAGRGIDAVVIGEVVTGSGHVTLR